MRTNERTANEKAFKQTRKHLSKAKKKEKKEKKMANPLQPFLNSLQNKMNEMENKNIKQIPERRVEVIKQLYTMLFSADGRELITTNERFRNVFIGKMAEFSAHPATQNDIQFAGMSRNMKTMIDNIIRGL